MNDFTKKRKLEIKTNILRSGGIILASEYTKHGCNIRGNLAIINCFDAMKDDPAAGQRSYGLIYDYLDEARAIMRETYQNFVERIAITELVCEV